MARPTLAYRPVAADPKRTKRDRNPAVQQAPAMVWYAEAARRF